LKPPSERDFGVQSGCRIHGKSISFAITDINLLYSDISDKQQAQAESSRLLPACLRNNLQALEPVFETPRPGSSHEVPPHAGAGEDLCTPFERRRKLPWATRLPSFSPTSTWTRWTSRQPPVAHPRATYGWPSCARPSRRNCAASVWRCIPARAASTGPPTGSHSRAGAFFPSAPGWCAETWYDFPEEFVSSRRNTRAARRDGTRPIPEFERGLPARRAGQALAWSAGAITRIGNPKSRRAGFYPERSLRRGPQPHGTRRSCRTGTAADGRRGSAYSTSGPRTPRAKGSLRRPAAKGPCPGVATSETRPGPVTR